MNNDKTIRLEVNYENGQWKEPEQQSLENTVTKSILELEDLNFETKEKIRSFWESESARKQLYNAKKDIQLLEIFQLAEAPPVSWSLGLNEEEYKLV